MAYNKEVQAGDAVETSFKLLKTNEFEAWLVEQSLETQMRVQLRLDRVAIDGHFGVCNYFDGIIEFKWKSGLRLYTARIGRTIVVILAGGTKHGQSKDIEKAKKILQKIKKCGFTTA